MAVISETYGYLFVHAPRTGGTALSDKVLVPQLEGRHVPRTPIEVRGRGGSTRTVRQHATPAQLIDAGVLGEDELSRLVTFTTVRNPFDSLVSGWIKRSTTAVGRPWTMRNEQVRERMRLAAELPFPAYLEHKFGHKSRPRHLYAAQIENADVVMRFEHLQADFDALLERLKVPRRIEIPYFNVTPDRERDYRQYYTRDARAIVERVFSLDLKRFGYEF